MQSKIPAFYRVFSRISKKPAVSLENQRGVWYNTDDIRADAPGAARVTRNHGIRSRGGIGRGELPPPAAEAGSEARGGNTERGDALQASGATMFPTAKKLTDRANQSQ